MSIQRRPEIHLETCPKCGEKSFFFNTYQQKWECLNQHCGKTLSNNIQFGVSLWLVNILESRHFVSFLICLGILLWAYLSTRFTNDDPISVAVGLGIPIAAAVALKLLLKQYVPSYRRLAQSRQLSRGLYGLVHLKLTRVFLILIIIAFLLWAIYLGYILLSFQTLHLVLTIILLIMVLVFFFWAIHIYRTSRRISRRPKFRPVFLTVLLTAAVLSFLNVYPFSIPKYAVTSFISQTEAGYKKLAADSSMATNTKPPVSTPSVQLPSAANDNKVILPVQPTKGSDSYTTSRVWVDSNTYMAGGDGSPVILVDNPNAKDPSWDQLVNFLRQDNTDRHPYILGSYVCADFAETLHNNAENAGIRAAWVGLQMGSSPYYPTGAGHACNAFQTTDRGLVYIDDTNFLGNGPGNADKIVDVKVGADYIPRLLFPEPGWMPVADSMGEVLKIEVVQW